MITIDMTKEEADYLRSLLKMETEKTQVIERKNEELAGFFKDNRKMNGNLCRKITRSLKKDSRDST
ncbi:hypothetical protein [Enterococcus sp. LJL51]|uniref:hypothetical protein n=1 Tax=Enterococcus sp. LJL51 TaxID=3416656 RepID=UPI003CEEA6EC